MLIDVVPVVRQLVPGLLKHAKPSVACVLTTHQKYLVFDADASRPACVVEIGDETRLRRIDGILTALHARCPREVPRSLACASWGPGTVVHIQEGLPGLPWFRLFETLTTLDRWQALLERSVAMMRKFHGAISDVPAWVGSNPPWRCARRTGGDLGVRRIAEPPPGRCHCQLRRRRRFCTGDDGSGAAR